MKTVCADPSLIGSQPAAVAHAIAPLLQLNEAALAQKLTPRSYLAKNAAGETVTNELHYVRLAKNVPEETWQRISAAMTNLTFGVNEKSLSRTNREFFSNLRQHAVYAEAGPDADLSRTAHWPGRWSVFRRWKRRMLTGGSFPKLSGATAWNWRCKNN